MILQQRKWKKGVGDRLRKSSTIQHLETLQIPLDAMRSEKQRGNIHYLMSVFQLDTLESDDPTHPSFGHLSLIPYPRSYTKTASRRPSCDTKQHVCQIHFIQTRGLGDTLWHCKTPIPSGFCKWSNQPAKCSSSITGTPITPKWEQMETWVKKTTTLSHSQQEPMDSTGSVHLLPSA